MPQIPVKVTVHGQDPLARARVLRHLERQSAIELTEPATVSSGEPAQEQTPEPPQQDQTGEPARESARDVAVLLAERFDERTGMVLRRLLSDGRPVVLITSQLPDTEEMAVAAYGVRIVLWWHRATPRRVAQAVRRAAHVPASALCEVDRGSCR